MSENKLKYQEHIRHAIRKTGDSIPVIFQIRILYIVNFQVSRNFPLQKAQKVSRVGLAGTLKELGMKEKHKHKTTQHQEQKTQVTSITPSYTSTYLSLVNACPSSFATHRTSASDGATEVGAVPCSS